MISSSDPHSEYAKTLAEEEEGASQAFFFSSRSLAFLHRRYPRRRPSGIFTIITLLIVVFDGNVGDDYPLRWFSQITISDQGMEVSLLK